MPDILESRLDNGLMALLKPIRAAPVATFWIWYRVGSRNEVPGCTGVSHWVEHMLFKGTPTFGKGAIFRLVNKNGGVNNALTFTDFTNYHETLPSDRIDLALQIEADRMVNALFDPIEVASERTVIISEREGAENDPRFWLDEQVQAATFLVHSYHHETIGWKSDLQAITRDDLYSHYTTYYAPNNAVIVAAGDFEADE
ncbi:MAG: insulinase family protein, partial [Chloroflexi bacterium]|nr:insulinase family protein [Chloroflexota bacterium]